MFDLTTSKLVRPGAQTESANTFFLYRHLWNPDSVLVFVHGLSGSPFDTWGDFPQLAFEDTDLGMADVALFKYDSSILRWHKLRLAPDRPIQDIAAELSDIVRDHLQPYRQISFIAHSLGGLIAKFALRRIIDFHRDTGPNRYSLFLVGTPNYGSTWASHIPSPALLLFSPEIACLRVFSSELEELQTFWNSRVRHDPNDNPDRVLITERAIISGLDRFVARGSGVGALSDQYLRRVPKSHTQLAKPTGDKDDVYLYVKATLRNTYTSAPQNDESRQRLLAELEDMAPEFLVKLRRLAELESQNRRSVLEPGLDVGDTRKRMYEEARRDLDTCLNVMRQALREVWIQFSDGSVRQRIREFANWYGDSMRSDEHTKMEPDAPGPQYLNRILEGMYQRLGSERRTPSQRIVTTILISDLHEFTHRMRNDEERMVRLLSVYTTAFDLALLEHMGRSVKSIGEATIAQFPSPLEALRCAIAVQQTLRRLRGSQSGFDLECRIGIHAGEVLVSSGDLYGPGVNVAAKMASLATPGLVILSDDAVQLLRKPGAYTFRALGKAVMRKSDDLGVFEIDPNSETSDPKVNHIVQVASGRMTKVGPPVEPSPPSIESRYASIENAIARLGTTPVFVRREELMREALSRVQSGPFPVVVFQGLPGIGKTTLLLGTARELRWFPYALAMRFAGPVAVEPAYLLEELNAFLTSLGRGMKPDTLQQQNQHRTLDTLLLQLTDLPVLVLLEHLDVLSVEWRESLLSGLGAAPQCRVMATARERPVDATRAHVLPVPPLSDQETLAFVTEYKRALELDIDPDTLIRQIPSAVRSHPQALATLLTNLVDLPLDLLVAQGVPEDAREATRLVQRIIASLDQEGRTALAFVEILTDIELGRAFRGLRLGPPLGFLPSLQVLLMRSLVYRIGTAYSVPPIVSDALRETDAAGMDQVAEHVVGAWLESTRRAEEPGTDLGILATIGTCIALRLWRRNRREWVQELMDEDFLEQLNRRGYWKEYSFLLQLGFRVAGELGDRSARRRLGFRFARKSLQLGDAPAARAALAEVEILIPAAPESLELAELHSHRAIICQLDRDLTASLQELSESRRIRAALGDRPGLAIVQKLIGNVQFRRKRYKQARHAFEEAIELLADDPGSKHRIDASTTLALCDLATGSLERAESRLRGAIADCDRFHYDAGRPRAMLNLALVLERRGPTGEVLELANAAAKAAEGTDPGLARFAERIASRLKDQGILGPKIREFSLTTGGDLEEVNRFFKEVTEEIVTYTAS